ncbi:cytidine deaminase [Candidatus Formimonas warabiya]|uniref:Cytidine deaminase n=1 Tax=Formimonas warabiya TaxID=1761012 RepID=A0A3G1KY02_FORW1|nr:cytidine deaminase [Candidatus Formimonas warabiya]ATW27321.1 cytidine deaminase [Candidatus Formimonas warabiya]
MDDRSLLALAEQAKEKAYAPYSQFRVGAALLTEEGKLFTGCNVENASYSLTNCAERTAVFSAVAAGCRNFSALAVTSDAQTYTYPCGACRQVLIEFNPDMKIIMGNINGEFIVRTAADLLPLYFHGDTFGKPEERK